MSIFVLHMLKFYVNLCSVTCVIDLLVHLCCIYYCYEIGYELNSSVTSHPFFLLVLLTPQLCLIKRAFNGNLLVNVIITKMNLSSYLVDVMSN